MMLPYLSFGAGAAMGAVGILVLPRIRTLFGERLERYQHGNGGTNASEPEYARQG
jgi:hypothetical protein